MALGQRVELWTADVRRRRVDGRRAAAEGQDGEDERRRDRQIAARRLPGRAAHHEGDDVAARAANPPRVGPLANPPGQLALGRRVPAREPDGAPARRGQRLDGSRSHAGQRRARL